MVPTAQSDVNVRMMGCVTLKMVYVPVTAAGEDDSAANPVCPEPMASNVSRSVTAELETHVTISRERVHVHQDSQELNATHLAHQVHGVRTVQRPVCVDETQSATQ